VERFLAVPRRSLPLGRTLHECLWRGSLPRAWTLPLDLVPDYHAGYRRTYVERDVRSLAAVSDPQLFSRFHGILAALTAQELNHSQLGRELGIARTTAQNWLSILIATWQWYELPAWHGNAIKRVSGRPKGHMGDSGMACASQVISSPRALAGHPLQGPLFETMVVGEIRRQCALLSPRPNLYHWRSHGGAELDLLLERDGRLFPVEVRAASQPRLRDCSGIAAFRRVYGSAVGPGLVVCASDRPRRIAEDDVAIPWDLGPSM